MATAGGFASIDGYDGGSATINGYGWRIRIHGRPRRADLRAADPVHDSGTAVAGIRVMVSSGFFLFFYSLTEAGVCKEAASVNTLTEAGKAIASVKATINHDLSTEADAKTASVKAFCPPRLRFV
jgi:hypothetical protein